MSLINEALRKAQRDRTPSQMYGATEQPANFAPGYAPQTNKRGLLIGLIIGIAVLIGLVAGLTITVLKKEPTPTQQYAQPPSPQPTAQAARTQPASLPEPTTATQPIQPLTARATATTTATTPATESDSAHLLEQLQLARAAAETKAEAAKKAAAEQPAKTTATVPPNQSIINWLTQARITGVRLSDSGNKVILNNKPYAVGETVHFGLGLKVLIIQQARILFIDANGKKYMKRL